MNTQSLIQWSPVKNSEREAKRKHPNWFIIREEGDKIYISPIDNTNDARWINRNQLEK